LDTDLPDVQYANRLEPRSGPTYVGPDLGSSLLAYIEINADNFFTAVILYPSIQWVKRRFNVSNYKTRVLTQGIISIRDINV